MIDKIIAILYGFPMVWLFAILDLNLWRRIMLVYKKVYASQKFGFPLIQTIGKLNKMVANLFLDHWKTELQIFGIPMCLVFQGILQV